MSERHIGRRLFLGQLGIAGLGVAGLSACNVSTDTGTGNSGTGTGLGFSADDIPDGVNIPEEDIVLSWMDSGDLKALFEEPFFAAYQEKYPNITIDYQPSSWDVINEAIPVAVRNDSAPDVFAVPNNVPVQVAISEGWIRPLDDVVPDFDQWVAGFPGGSFVPGVHVFDGKTYAWPMNSSKRSSYLQIVHPPFLEEADVDPAERLTFSGLRDACRKITQNGGGEYYGLMISAAELGGTAINFAQLSGLPIMSGGVWTGLDHRTGEYNLTSPEVIEAFELLLAIESDGSFFPGYMGLDDATARSRFPQGVAGFFFDGPWAIPRYQSDNPDFEFAIVLPPTADDGSAYHQPFWEVGANQAYVSAGTQYPAVVGDMFKYLGSVEGQANIVVASKGNLASVVPEANDRASGSTELDEQAVAAVNFANEVLRSAPDARVRNPDIAQVVLELDRPSPSLREIGELVFTGQAEPRTALQQLQDDSNRGLDEAIAAAQAKGADVSRDDFHFPNWDPTVDYTSDDYAGL